jgi:hypothetical protein
MPPTLAGETRLTNDEAAWVRVVGQKGTGPGTAEPTRLVQAMNRAIATYWQAAAAQT